MKRFSLLLLPFLLATSCDRVLGMSVIRRLTNEIPNIVTNVAPPVVVTNSPPPVTPDPEPEVPTDRVSTWAVKEVKAWDLPFKVMFWEAVPRGRLVSIYDRQSRTDSRVLEFSGGAWRTVWDGDEETIGDLPEVGATAYQGATFMAAERGKSLLIYDHASGAVRRGAAIPGGYKWNITTATWQGRPLIGADGPDKRSIVFDGLTGKTLFQTALDGLVAGLAEDDKGVLWCAISDGQQGLCNSAGWSTLEVKPASVAFWPGVGVVAGSMVDGRIWRMVGGKPVQLADLKCSKVNRLAYDGRRGVLLAAGSKPDTFVVLHRSGAQEQVARFADEAQEVSGEQFDACISAGPGDLLLFGRATPSGAKIYEASPAGATGPGPLVVPDPTPVVTKFDPEAAKWMNRSAKGFKVTSTLRAEWSYVGSKRGIRMKMDPPMRGKNCYAAVLIQRDILYAGTFDSIGEADGEAFKGPTNLGHKNTKGGPYIAGNDSALRKKLMPQPNEDLGIMCECVDTEERTTVSVILWQPEK